jgi:tetratricopeptide (TPR) repeat protein
MMSDYEANPDSTDDQGPSAADRSNDGKDEPLSPLDGGRWRPVSPDELLRKNVPDPDHDDQEDRQKVQLERRQELQHKLKTNPTDLEGFLELAAIYRQEQRPLEAKRLLQQALQIFPEQEEVRFQHEEAILARSLQQFREVSDLAQRLKTPEADRELDRSRSDWACRRIDVCRARLERDPSQMGLRMTMAEAKYDAEMFDESFAEAGQLLELDEWSANAHFLRARCLLALGKDLPAMKELRAVALRRSVVAPERLRHASLRLLCDLSEKLSLQATGNQYREHLRRLEQAPAK